MNRAIALAFGRVLRSAREAAGLSQETLAIRADLDRTYPSLLERGLRSPTLGTLMTLAPALGVAPEALVRRTEAQLRRSPSEPLGENHAQGERSTRQKERP
jgi:transcriptional regulator with XRE-family HTH domain